MAQQTEHRNEQGCAVDCGMKGATGVCPSEGACADRPKLAAWLFLFVAAFVTAVWAMANFGGPVLEIMGRHEKTVGMLDMARQSAIKKEYGQAESLYKQAISDAEVEGGDRLAYALASYAEFLRKRKRGEEAAPLEERAKKIQGISPVSH